VAITGRQLPVPGMDGQYKNSPLATKPLYVGLSGMALKIIGVFENNELAQAAQSYLTANGFSDGDHAHDDSVPDEHTLVNLALLDGSTLTLHLETLHEAQEGVDVLNNHGAIDVQVITQ
jgi:hypothetical protein